MDRWAWEQLTPWLQLRAGLPAGALFCVLRGPTRGRPRGLRRRPIAAAHCGRASRGAPSLRSASTAACSCGRDVPRGRWLLVIQRQLGHADLAITSVSLRGIDNTEIVHAFHERPAPMIQPATGYRSCPPGHLGGSCLATAHRARTIPHASVGETSPMRSQAVRRSVDECGRAQRRGFLATGVGSVGVAAPASVRT